MLEKWGLRFGKIVSKVKPRDVVKKWKIFIGDTVEIIEGKDKGKQGKVINIIKPFNQVFVEGLNLATKHVKPEYGQPGGIHRMEVGINLSKVSLIDPITKKPSKVKWEFKTDENGILHKIRLSKKSNVEIPRPPLPPKKPYIPGEFDTKPEDVLKVTFMPSIDHSPIPKDCIL